MNTIKSAVTRAKKKIVSFFREIFGSPKGLGVVSYTVTCATLWHKFADHDLVYTVLHDFPFSWEIVPPIM